MQVTRSVKIPTKRHVAQMKPTQAGVALFGARYYFPNELMHCVLDFVNFFVLVPLRRVSKQFAQLLHIQFKRCSTINLINERISDEKRMIRVSQWVPNVQQVWIATDRQCALNFDKYFGKLKTVMEVTSGKSNILPRKYHVQTINPPQTDDLVKRLHFWLCKYCICW